MSTYYAQGRYRLRIESAAQGMSKAKDDGSSTDQIELGVSILGQYDQNQLLECAGPPRTVFLPLTDTCLGSDAEPGWVWATLLDLGFKGPSFADLTPLIGAERDGNCKYDNFSGTDQEKWSIYRQGRAPLRPAQPAQVRALDAKYKSLLRTAGKAAAAPAAPARPTSKPAARPQPSAAEPQAHAEAETEAGDPIPF